MHEIEIKFLDIDPQKIEKRLLSLGAKKIFDEILEEWIFQRPDWQAFRGRARIRSGGGKTTVAYKETTKKSSEGNVEIEFEVDNKEHAHAFIHKLGVPQIRHQQKRRIHFILDTVAVDIDFWPEIPPFIEIEGVDLPSIEKVTKQLGFSLKDACELDARQVIQDVYQVDIDSREEYIF